MKKTNILYNFCTTPSYNLACEEYFLLHKTEPYIIIWRNSPSVIIGRNQNAYKEVNIEYTQKNNIPIIRRLTGGGAVFHDLGNINYTYIFDGDNLENLKERLSNVIDFLNSLNLNAEFSGRNDILIDGKKISGTAQACLSHRCIVHGTLLYSSVLTDINSILTPNKLKLQSKGISSVKSRVTNISEHLEKDTSVEEFMKMLYEYLSGRDDCQPYEISETDKKNIAEIETKKYGTWEWNLGENPEFSIEKTVSTPCGLITAHYSVNKGKISEIKIFGDFSATGNINELEQLLCGLTIKKEDIEKQLSKIPFENYIKDCQPEFLLPLF